MIFQQVEITALILSALLFAPEIAARIVKYYRAVIAWRDCVDDIGSVDGAIKAIKAVSNNTATVSIETFTEMPKPSPKVKRYAVSPVDVFAITKGKRYEILSPDDSEFGFYITADNLNKIYCLYSGCGHISYKDWQIIEEPVSEYELVGTDFVKRDEASIDALVRSKLSAAQAAVFNDAVDKTLVDGMLKPKKKPKAMTAPIKKLPKDAKVYEYGKPKLPKIPRGYTRHYGGKCPVKRCDVFDIIHRDGFRHNGSKLSDDTTWRWTHNGTDTDIIAYRLSKRKVG